MRVSQTQEGGTLPGAAGARFIPAHRVVEACAELKARRYVVARVASPKAAERRRERAPERGSAPPPRATGLRGAIEEAVESALALRGALPPGVSVHADLAICIRDQMLRVRALGATGLAIALPRLGDILEPGLLDAEDSAVLSAWIRAAQNEPLTLLLDDQDRTVAALAPVPLELLVQAASGARTMAIKPDIAPPVPVATRAGPSDPRPESAASKPASIPQASIVLTESACGGALAEEPVEEAPETRPAARHAHRAPPTVPAPLAPEPALPPPEPVAGDPSTAERLLTAAEWRSYAMDLDNARGPKPASVIDRLFVTRYMPLLGAIARGQADAMVKGVADTFRSNFVHSYIESFPALRVTGKRPPMVLDVPDLAARLGRLNGARAIRLLLIDSLRYDLGERLTARLQHRLSGRAVCVERTLLWAALPTTTPTQIALLARGPDGLRDPPIESDPEPDVVRGRAVSTIRRERVGAREVMKLDVVEARLRGAGPAFDERFDRIAEELAELVARFFETLSARTLLYVFGDHGFCMPSEGRSTGPATQGGASPEEVLVPGYAWLVGGMH